MLSRNSLSASSISLVLLLVTCGPGDAPLDRQIGWTGTVRDSAGIRIVRNPDVGIWPEGQGWVVSHELSIGDIAGPPEYQFGQVRDVDVASDGRIYVLDELASAVRIFGPDGSFLSSFGQSGEGPGEFTPGAPPGWIIATGSRELFLPDVESGRAHRFTLDGGLIETRRLAVRATGAPWAEAPGGGYLHTPAGSGPGWALVRIDSEGVVLDTVRTFATGRIVRPSGVASWQPILLPGPIYATTTDDRVVSGVTDLNYLEVADPEGEVQVIFSKGARSPLLTASESEALELRGRLLLEERLKVFGEPSPELAAMVQSVTWGLPERLPSYTGIVGGPAGTIWVQRPSPIDSMSVEVLNGQTGWVGAGSPVWDVFTSSGHFLGPVTLPRRFRLRRIRGQFVYGVERGDLDVERVVRLRITDASGAPPLTG